VTLEVLRRRGWFKTVPQHPAFSLGMGALAGFGTTVGHAAGPVMNIYFLSRDMGKNQFMGTQAWFFFIVNLAKVPVLIPQGNLTMDGFMFALKVLPAVLVGVLAGFLILPRLSLKLFNAVVLVLAFVAGGYLVCKAFLPV
jgi:hypothetical protein